ncbi:MAG: helix-turn-helix transcriptional regulator [Ruminiclostridium sp.]|nr:helix-turn-helix transcriptional regulator [Ruminiclostridium sp.]
MKHFSIFRFVKKYSFRVIISLLVVLLPMFLFNMTFFKYFRDYQYNQLISQNQTIAHQAKDALNIVLRNIERGILNLSIVNYVEVEKKIDMEGYYINQLLDNMSGIITANEYIDSIYYVNMQKNKVVVSNYGITDMGFINEHLRKRLNDRNEITYTEMWKNKNGVDIASIIIREDLYRFSPRVVVYNLNIKKLYDNYINAFGPYQNGVTAYLFDEKDNLLAPIDESSYDLSELNRISKMDGDIIKYELSNGWYIVMSYDKDIILKPLSDILLKMLLIFLLVVLFTSVLVYLAGRKIYRPITNWLAVFNIVDQSLDSSDIDILDNTLQKLISTNQEMEQKNIHIAKKLKNFNIGNIMLSKPIPFDYSSEEYKEIKLVVVLNFTNTHGLGDFQFLWDNELIDEVELIKEDVFCFNNTDNLEVAVYAEAKSKHLLDKLLKVIIEYSDTKTNVKALVEYEYFSDINMLHEAYDRCSMANRRRLYAMLFDSSMTYAHNSLQVMENIFNTGISEGARYLQKSFDNDVMTDFEKRVYRINLFITIYEILKKNDMKTDNIFYRMLLDGLRSVDRKETHIFPEVDMLAQRTSLMDGKVIPFGDQHMGKYKSLIKEFIEKNYEKNVSLAELSELLGVSKQYLCSIIKKIYNETFVDVLNKYRIEKARSILVQTHLSVEEIAVQVGFMNRSYFTNVFKKKMGVTPGEYRNFQT